MWAGAPVPPLPQPPIEEHGKGSRPSPIYTQRWVPLQLWHRARLWQIEAGRKEQHAGPALSDGWPREEREGLNQITLVTLARLVLLSLPALAKERERKERRQEG